MAGVPRCSKCGKPTWPPTPTAVAETTKRPWEYPFDYTQLRMLCSALVLIARGSNVVRAFNGCGVHPPSALRVADAIREAVEHFESECAEAAE